MNTYTDDYADDDISSEATVTWRQSEDLTVYAAYKEGYKSGGFNNSAVLTAGLDRSALAYGPETASGFEVGVRPRFFNRALRLGLVAYDYDYKNLQVQIFDAATVSFRLSNAGKLRTRGLEFEAQYDVPTVKGLEFHGSLGYNKATYANYIGACFEGQTVAEGCKLGFNGTAFTSQDYDGRTPARAPRVSGVVGFSYQFPIGEGLDFALSGDGRYSSAYYYSESLQPDARQSAYWMYDASARVIGGDGRWELALIGKNLSDKLYVMHANAVPYTATGTGTNSGVRADLNGSVSRPREIWLQATYRY
jgi:outer membrane receptor protein involved in Fe transport